MSSNPDLTINLRSGNGTSFAGCGQTTIYSGNPYGTTLHEFGHAVVGLSDTYSGRQAGACKSGQPQSAMCWGAYGKKDAEGYSMLYPDDVSGAQANYRNLFSDLNPPSVKIDPFAVLDVRNPWPKSPTINPDQNSAGLDKLFVALGRSHNSNKNLMEIIVSAPIEDIAMYACIGDVNSRCTENEQERFNSSIVGIRGDRRIFKLDKPLSITENSVFSIFSVKEENGEKAWNRVEKVRFLGH